MFRHPLKIGLATLTLTAALAAVDAPVARAFTETKVPPASAQSAPLTSEPKIQLQKPADGAGLELATPGDSESGDTKLSIPGVGTIGTVPKLNCGLELLYGGSNEDPGKPLNETNDDVLIKGTIKHRF
ncbi:MAG: hypothetical protein WBP94_09485 [Rhodomicrobiaceae bacterium]